MKQKKINNILYVFDVTPYEIVHDTDATTIKVQEECVAGFKELNTSLASKIVAYNYHTICANQQEWAPYVALDDPDYIIISQDGGGIVSTPTFEILSEIKIGEFSITGTNIGDVDYKPTVGVYPGQTKITFYVKTGLAPTGGGITFKFRCYDIENDEYIEYGFTTGAPDGEIVIGKNTGSENLIITYDENPETGYPWVSFVIPEVSAPLTQLDEIRLAVTNQGS